MSDLRARWQGREGAARARAALELLATGGSLGALDLGACDGRVDLRGIVLPEPEVLGSFDMFGSTFEHIDGVIRLEGVELRSIDFRGAVLNGLQLMQSRIVDCRFDDASCRHWHLWAVVVADTSFTKTDFRSSSLGACDDGIECRYERVSFRESKWFDVTCTEAAFTDCDFAGVVLRDLDFASSRFARCHFSGELHDVLFWDRRVGTCELPPNTMEDVDFTGATLRWCGFHRLDLDRVRWPQDDDHLVVRHFRRVVPEAVERLLALDDPRVLGAVGLLEHAAEWVGPHQEIGIFHRADILEAVDGDPAQAAVVIEVLDALQQEASQ